MLKRTPWMQPPAHGTAVGFRAKTPKTKVSSYTLPQGWSAKREIILNDRSVVQNFLIPVWF